LNTLGACFGAGAAAVSLMAAFYPALLRFPPPKHAGGTPLRHSTRFLRDRYVWLTGGLLICQSGTEITLAGFTTTYLVTEFQAPLADAALALTGLWVTVTLARLALRFSGHRIVQVSSAIALAGVSGLVLSQSFAATFTISVLERLAHRMR
jgi:fucose permease